MRGCERVMGDALNDSVPPQSPQIATHHSSVRDSALRAHDRSAQVMAAALGSETPRATSKTEPAPPRVLTRPDRQNASRLLAAPRPRPVAARLASAQPRLAVVTEVLDLKAPPIVCEAYLAQLGQVDG
jgi:hypothetical protein